MEWANEVVCATWEEVERAEAEALPLVAALGETGTDTGWVGYVALEDSSTIGDVLSDVNHYGAARNLCA